MTIEDVSDTALWVAAYRAQESERPDPAFRDPLAGILTGERGRQIAASMPYARIMAWVMVIRTVAIDRLITKAIEEGVDTVLNLGCGLDTRPYRMSLPEALRWIEVDFPNLIALKNEKLRGEKPVCRLERIAQDLSARPARQALFSKIGGEAKKTLIITEGVIPYLTNGQAAELADDLHAIPSFQYWIQDFYPGGLGRRTPRSWRKKLAAAPFLFKVDDWHAFFAERGWRPYEILLTLKEAKRLARRPPFIFPWSLIMMLLPRRQNGYVLLRTAPSPAPLQGPS